MATAPVILKRFNSYPKDFRKYFNDFPKLVKGFEWEVSIGYLFSLVELAHNTTIYCGVVKLHKVDKDLAWEAVNNQHIKRESFWEFYKKIFKKLPEKNVLEKLGNASKTRNLMLHGKTIPEKEKRKAVDDILSYASEFNKAVDHAAGFKPFGPLKGFKGRAMSLSKDTSRWVLKGMGFSM